MQRITNASRGCDNSAVGKIAVASCKLQDLECRFQCLGSVLGGFESPVWRCWILTGVFEVALGGLAGLLAVEMILL